MSSSSTQYRTVDAVTVHEIEVRRSRFSCALAAVESEDEARAFITGRRKAEPAARHHCHAFLLGVENTAQRSSDDGEPRGTAGVPILEVLLRNELTNVVAVVSRHFGGVKLGAGGLVRAYSAAVSETLARSTTVLRKRMTVLIVTVAHSAAGKLENALRHKDCRLLSTEFTANAEFEVAVQPAARAQFETWLRQIAPTAELRAGLDRWL